jgi:hypothetical protein
MERKTVEQQLQELLPRSLDDIIRKNRERASLRLATDADKQAIAHRIASDESATPISRWNLVTLDVRGTKPITILVGWNDVVGTTWNTSPILQLDAESGLLVTRSGTLYKMSGKSSDKIDLLCICAWLHQTPAGKFLGVPEIFY